MSFNHDRTLFEIKFQVHNNDNSVSKRINSAGLKDISFLISSEINHQGGPRPIFLFFFNL